MKKILTTMKITMIALALAFVGSTVANAEPLTPVKEISALNSHELDPVSYEQSMEKLYEQITAKDEANLRLCKIFSEK